MTLHDDSVIAPAGARLLDGVRVLEWSDSLSAAFCVRILADLGAGALKLEHPLSGDPLRAQGPFVPEGRYGADSALFAYANHGKRSITLDPAQPSGAHLLLRLAADADLLVMSEPLARLEKLGLGIEALHEVNAALVILTVTSFGASAEAPASTDFTLTHHAGYAFHQARPVLSPDAQPPVACADREVALAAGVAAANAALWGLLDAEQSGTGRHVDCAQADVIAHLLIEPLADYDRGERHFSRLREKLQGTEVAGGLIWLLPCIDGHVMISPREEHQWQRWVGLLGNPAWSRDAALCGERAARNVNWEILQDRMSEWTREHTRAQVFALAQAARVACFPVSGARDLLENEQLHARRFFDRWQADASHAIPMPGLPFAVRTASGATLPRAREVRAPLPGEANCAVFEERLGLTRGEIETLRRHGVV
jgi:crotonobetainyl-CoA:carnitine CoA-transferase CaiB-like acyl-CoA transferase